MYNYDEDFEAGENKAEESNPGMDTILELSVDESNKLSKDMAVDEYIEKKKQDEEEKELEKEREKEKKKEKEQPRRKIIYVDDLNYHLITAQHRLKEAYEIYPAQSAEILFEVLENVYPELILLDINMPDVNGYDIIEQLKNDSRYCEIPVIFLTGRSDKKSIMKGLQLGAVDFIIKPFDAADVIDSVEYQLDAQRRNAIRPSILAIDDDPSILQSINSLLSDLYTIYTVPGVSSEKAIKEILKKIVPDLFLLDCNMPGMSGIEIVQVIQDMPFYEDTPIVFLTADGSRDNVYVAVSANINGFIVKPINKDILRERMADLLKDFMKVRRIRSIGDKLGIRN